MYDLRGKIALVTGTARKKGIGRGIALRLAREGADVVVTDIMQKPGSFPPWEIEEGWQGLESLVSEIKSLGRSSFAITGSVAKSEEADMIVTQAIKEFCRIDILVNNAGLTTNVLGVKPVTEISNEDWEKAIGVNLSGVFYMCRAVAREMIKKNNRGKIINIASVAGKTAGKHTASYNASKFGVLGLTKAVAMDLAPYKINVNAVCPHAVATWGRTGPAIYEAMKTGLTEREAVEKVYGSDPRMQTMLPPLGGSALVDDIVNMVAFLTSDQADYVTGQAINVDGGFLTAL